MERTNGAIQSQQSGRRRIARTADGISSIIKLRAFDMRSQFAELRSKMGSDKTSSAIPGDLIALIGSKICMGQC